MVRECEEDIKFTEKTLIYGLIQILKRLYMVLEEDFFMWYYDASDTASIN